MAKGRARARPGAGPTRNLSLSLSAVTGHSASHYIGRTSEQPNILSYFYSDRVGRRGDVGPSRGSRRIVCTCERVFSLSQDAVTYLRLLV